MNELEIYLFFPNKGCLNKVLYAIFGHVKQNSEKTVEEFNDVVWRQKTRWESCQSHIDLTSRSIKNDFWDPF